MRFLQVREKLASARKVNQHCDHPKVTTIVIEECKNALIKLGWSNGPDI